MRYKDLLAKLLHYANSGPQGGSRFYDVKKRLLWKYGTYRGDTLQKIVKPCWGDYNRNYDEYEVCGDGCRKCGGTGVFSTVWHRLRKYEFCGFQFLIPDGSTSIPPETPEWVTITGRIEHRDYGLWSSEAELWLYLLAGEWRQFFRQFRGSFYYTPGWCPLLRIQKTWVMPRNYLGKIKRKIQNKYRAINNRLWPPEVPF